MSGRRARRNPAAPCETSDTLQAATMIPAATWRTALAIAHGAALLLLVGCRGDLVPVSGRVTWNDKPLAGAVVTFQPIRSANEEPPTASGSVGRTDEQGYYQLRAIEPSRAGALVGPHAVTISLSDKMSESAASDGQLPRADRLPKTWHDGSQRFDVPPGGTTEAHFDIRAP